MANVTLPRRSQGMKLVVMHRALTVATIAVTIAVLTAASNTRPAGATRAASPVAFLTRIVQSLVANRYSEVWPSLNPIDREAAPLATYVACEGTTPILGKLTSIRVVRVRKQPVRIAPELMAVPSVAVAFVLRLASARTVATVPVTAHAVQSAGAWTWILPPERLAMYRQNTC
jgi:hypothetical protein